MFFINLHFLLPFRCLTFPCTFFHYFHYTSASPSASSQISLPTQKDVDLHPRLERDSNTCFQFSSDPRPCGHSNYMGVTMNITVYWLLFLHPIPEVLRSNLSPEDRLHWLKYLLYSSTSPSTCEGSTLTTYASSRFIISLPFHAM